MSNLKKVVLLSIVLFFDCTSPFFMIYSMLLFGNQLTDSQWLSVIILSVLGMITMTIFSLVMQ